MRIYVVFLRLLGLEGKGEFIVEWEQGLQFEIYKKLCIFFKCYKLVIMGCRSICVCLEVLWGKQEDVYFFNKFSFKEKCYIVKYIFMISFIFRNGVQIGLFFKRI